MTLNSLNFASPIQSILSADDPAKDEAQKMADYMQTLADNLSDLQKDPKLADESAFWTLITNAIDHIYTEYNYLQSGGPISTSDLSKLFDKFNSNVLSLRISPSGFVAQFPSSSIAA